MEFGKESLVILISLSYLDLKKYIFVLSNNTTRLMTSLQDAVANANKALSLCLCNKFTEAENYLKPL